MMGSYLKKTSSLLSKKANARINCIRALQDSNYKLFDFQHKRPRQIQSDGAFKLYNIY